LKASRALLKHISTDSNISAKLNLLHDADDPAENAEIIWLIVTTKKYITDKRKLKPMPIRLPHALLNPESNTVCLIVKDPQRTYKDLVATAELTSTVTKVVGFSKLRAKFKAFESRRRLCDSHDVFLADDRIVTMLPNVLGVTFYRKTSKVPIPVNIGREPSAANMKNQISKALSSTYVHIAPAANTSIRVGLSNFTPEQIAENVEKAVGQLTNKIPGGWSGLRCIYIKTINSPSLPIYMTTEMYADEDVLTPEQEQVRLQNLAKRAAHRKEKKKNKLQKIAERRGLAGVKGALMQCRNTEEKEEGGKENRKKEGGGKEEGEKEKKIGTKRNAEQVEKMGGNGQGKATPRKKKRLAKAANGDA
jgi:ribosome biogenesis protein UTP30